MQHYSIEEATDILENQNLNPAASRFDLKTTWPLVRPFLIGLSKILGKRIKPFILALVTYLDNQSDSPN